MVIGVITFGRHLHYVQMTGRMGQDAVDTVLVCRLYSPSSMPNYSAKVAKIMLCTLSVILHYLAGGATFCSDRCTLHTVCSAYHICATTTIPLVAEGPSIVLLCWEAAPQAGSAHRHM